MSQIEWSQCDLMWRENVLVFSLNGDLFSRTLPNSAPFPFFLKATTLTSVSTYYVFLSRTDSQPNLLCPDLLQLTLQI